VTITINLLPDVRLNRLRSERIRRIATATGVGIWVVIGGLVVGLFLITGGQKFLIDNATSDIKTTTAQIQSVNGLTDALTAQATLTSLPALYDSRTYFSKFVPIVAAAMPADVNISSMATDTNNLLTITGTGASAFSVDRFYESLKAAGAKTTAGAYFSNVALPSIVKDPTGNASFSLSATVSIGAINGQK